MPMPAVTLKIRCIGYIKIIYLKKFILFSSVSPSIDPRLERELEELETGLSATSTKENLPDAVQEVNTMTVEKMVSSDQQLFLAHKLGSRGYQGFY